MFIQLLMVLLVAVQVLEAADKVKMIMPVTGELPAYRYSENGTRERWSASSDRKQLLLSGFLITSCSAIVTLYSVQQFITDPSLIVATGGSIGLTITAGSSLFLWNVYKGRLQRPVARSMPAV
jgi:hypothetical protein